MNIDSRIGRAPFTGTALEDLSKRAGPADDGPKNGLAAWTYGGNYTDPSSFVDALGPFWDDLLRHPVPGGPLRFNRIVVIYQLQDCERAGAIEIYLKAPPVDVWQSEDAWAAAPLVTKAHESLPFRW